jgi:hypothetical protein
MGNISIDGYSTPLETNISSSGHNGVKINEFSSILRSVENNKSTTGTSQSDDVTLYDKAKGAGSYELPGWVQKQAESYRNNPDQNEAMRAVRVLATTPSSGSGHGAALVSVPENFAGPLHYTVTGSPVTKENAAKFEALAQSIDAESKRIFDTEFANGATAAEIFEKIQHYMSTQPEDYLEALNWYRSEVMWE